MRRQLTAIAGALALAIAAAGCNDFLSKEGVATDPNNPTQATRDQYFIASQTALAALLESGLGQLSCMYMQQCTGTGGRFVEQRGTNYTTTPGDFNADWAQVYDLGGLIDVRKVRASADSAGDRTYSGIAKVLESMIVSFAADMWGDIPYREAVAGNQMPVFDPQAQVYADLQSLLDDAIADLESGEGEGPGDRDLIYRGDRSKWIEAAHTLKARLYLHTAEIAGSTPLVADGGQPFDPAAYQSAISEATQGISSAANDLTMFHGDPTSQRNIWYQFAQTSFGLDLVAGAYLVNLMESRGDPRLAQYFDQNSAGEYRGLDVNGTVETDVSPLGGTRIQPTFRQPVLTYVENELILAEAYFRTGNPGLALTHVNNARDSYGAAHLGAVTLQDIMLEKYIALFQNPEVWQDYKRTCFPRLDPAKGVDEIPGRVYYGQQEENVNTNAPSSAEQAQNGGVAGGRAGVGGFRNPNDPNACPDPNPAT